MEIFGNDIMDTKIIGISGIFAEPHPDPKEVMYHDTMRFVFTILTDHSGIPVKSKWFRKEDANFVYDTLKYKLKFCKEYKKVHDKRIRPINGEDYPFYIQSLEADTIKKLSEIQIPPTN